MMDNLLFIESGHIKVAQTHIGQVHMHIPPDPKGLWIDQNIAEVFNDKNEEAMRQGFRMAIFNSRGAHVVDPSRKSEIELSKQYKYKAEEVENKGYQRFVLTLRELADTYRKDAERIISESKSTEDY